MSGSKKYSLGLPEDLAEAIRAQVGPGVSPPIATALYIATALEHRVAMDGLGEIVDDYAKDHGRPAQEENDAARAELRHDKDGATGAAA